MSTGTNPNAELDVLTQRLRDAAAAVGKLKGKSPTEIVNSVAQLQACCGTCTLVPPSPPCANTCIQVSPLM